MTSSDTTQPTDISITAQRIRELRLRYEYTQQELADLAELERKSIIRYESGNNIPGGKALKNLASVFGVTSDYILGISDDSHPIPASDSDLSSLELEAIQAFRRARNDAQRKRILNALNEIVEVFQS